MNIKDLEYLIAIAEEGHFNKAAQRCFVSQPTLSGQLKKLEQELGVLLVARTNRSVQMTEVGLAVCEQARRILADSRVLKEIAQSFHDPMAGGLQLGLIPTIAPYLLPLIMPSMKKHYPKLKLWLHEHQTNILLTKLRNSELDVLILALPVSSNEFSEYDLYKEPFYLATASTNHLAHKIKVSLNDLNKAEMLLLEEGHCLRGQALDICLNAGANEYSGFQATSLETLRHMVAEGMGSTLMPKLAVPKRTRKDDSISYVEFKNPQPTRRIGMLFRKQSYRESTFIAVAKTIKEQMKDI